MTDWSKYTTPTESSISNTEWNKYAPGSEQQAQVNPVQSSLINKIKNIPTAIIGGLSEGGADIAQGIADTPTFILEKLGAISPETAKKLYASTAADVAPLRTNYNPGDALSQAYQKDPLFLGSAAKAATDIAGMAGAMRAVPFLGSAAKAATSELDTISPLLAKGAGLTARAGGMGLIGAAGANPEDKQSAFTLSAAMQPMFEVAGAAAYKYLAPRATTILGLKEQAIANKAETKNINALYDKIKQAPFTQDDSSQIYQLVRKAEDFLLNNANLSTNQKSILQDDIIKKLGSAVNHDQVLDVYKNLGANNKAFKGSSRAIYDIYKSARDEIGSILQNATKRAGEVDDVLSKASQAANQQRILNKVFGNIIENPEKFSPNKASNILVKEINNLVKDQADPEMIKSMRGLNRVIKEIPKAPYIKPDTAAYIVGGSAGYGSGNIPLGVLAGGSVYALTSYLNNFVKTEQGLKFLSSLAKPGITQKDIRNIVKAIGMAGAEWEKNNILQKPSNIMENAPVLTTGIRN